MIKIANYYDLTIIDPKTQKDLYGDLFDLKKKRIIRTDALNELLRVNNDSDFKINVMFNCKVYMFNKIKIVEDIYKINPDPWYVYADWKNMQLDADGHLSVYINTNIGTGLVDLTSAKLKFLTAYM